VGEFVFCGACLLCRYDEPNLLKQVEARLAAPIPSLNDDLSLPAHIQVRLWLEINTKTRDMTSRCTPDLELNDLCMCLVCRRQSETPLATILSRRYTIPLFNPKG
jgi:hypothetical protein